MKHLLNLGRLTTLLSIIIFVCSSSCTPNSRDFPVYYTIINHTGSCIRVEFHGQWDNNSIPYNSSLTDTLVYYRPGEKRILLVRLYTDYYENRVENGDSIWGISSLKIYRDDTITVQKNYLLLKYWKFGQTSNYKSEMSLEITNESFEPQ